MKRVHELEVEAFSRQSNSQRYNYFVEKVFQWQEAWGLWDDEGWVLAEAQDKNFFPLWPAEPFAKNCQVNDWSNTQTRSIKFNELTEQLLPDLIEHHINVAVFLVPNSNHCGVLPAQELLKDFLTLQSNKIINNSQS